METKLIPNTTQIPNVLMDFVIPGLPEGEAKCLLYICRRTYGFHKDQDRISLSQFIKGIKTRDGKVLDNGAGVSRSVAVMSLKSLEFAGAILVGQNTKGNIFKINLDCDISQVVRKVNQFRKQTKSGSETRPKQVRIPNLQKKGNIGNKEKICLILKKWNETQSSPIANFKAENIVNKHGPEKIDQLIKYYGQRNGGFHLFITSLNS